MMSTASSPAFRGLLAAAIVTLTFAAIAAPKGADGLFLWPAILVFYAILGHAMIWPIKARPDVATYVTPESLFLIFCLLVFILPYQLHLLDLFDLTQSRFVRQTFADRSNAALAMSVSGIAAFYLGARWRLPTPSGEEPPAYPAQHSGLLPLATVAALLTLIVLYFAAGWRASGEGRYTGTASGGAIADGVSLLILILAMVAVALTIARLTFRQPITPSVVGGTAIALAWAAYLTSAGDRNGALMIAIVALGGMATFCFRVSRWAILIAFIMALAVYGIVEHSRMPAADSAIALRPAQAGETSFNISTIATRAALAAVPDQIAFGLGYYKAIGIAGIVPLIRGAVMSDSVPFAATADVLTFVMLPPDAGWNVGSNIIADLYLDFGVAGVPLVLFGLGLFTGWIRNRMAQRPGTTAIVLYLLTLASFAELPRYSADFPLRFLVWAGVFMGAVRLLTPASMMSPAPLEVRT